MQVRVNRWIDGDTFEGIVETQGAVVRRFRLMDCWCPERGQTGFAECLAFVVMWFGDGVFEIANDYVHSDRYGRLVVDLRLKDGRAMSGLINAFVEARGYPRGKGWPGQSVP